MPNRKQLAVYLIIALLAVSMCASFVNLLPPAKATTIFYDGFESGTSDPPDPWSEFRTGAYVGVTHVHSGSYALKSNGSQGYAYKDEGATGYADSYLGVWYYMTVLPSQYETLECIQIKDVNDLNQVIIGCWNTGSSVSWFIKTDDYHDSGVTGVQVGWYFFEMRRKTGSGNGIATFWLNDTQIQTRTSETFTANSRYYEVGTAYCDVPNFENWVDDVYITDSWLSMENATGSGGGGSYSYLTALSASGGTTTPSTGIHEYALQSKANITATPSANYQLSYWKLDGAPYGNNITCDISMNVNHTIQPVFDLFYQPVSTVTQYSETRGVLLKYYYDYSHNDTLICETLASYGFNTVFIELDPCYYTGLSMNDFGDLLTACHQYGLEFHVLLKLGITDTDYTDGMESGYSYGFTGWRSTWCGVWDNGTTCNRWAAFSRSATQTRVQQVISVMMTNYPTIDGVSFDYARYPTSDMLGESNPEYHLSYDDEAKATFQSWLTSCNKTFTGSWSDYYYGGANWADYAEWRCIPINNMIRDCETTARSFNSKIKFSAEFWTPWKAEGWYPDTYKAEIGQDVPFWISQKYLDYICPMIYEANVADAKTVNDKIQQYMMGISNGTGAIPLVPFITQGGEDVGVAVKSNSTWIAEINYYRECKCNGFIIWRYVGTGFGDSSFTNLIPYLQLIKYSTIKGAFTVFQQSRPQIANDVVVWQTTTATIGKVEYSTQPIFNYSANFHTINYMDTDYVNGSFVNDTTPSIGHALSVSLAKPFFMRIINNDNYITITSPIYYVTEGWISADRQHYINLNNTNIDDVTNIGGQSNFTAQQRADKINDTLTEANVNDISTSTWFGNSATSGTSYTLVYTNVMMGDVFTSGAYAISVYNVTWYGRSTSGTRNVKACIVDASGNLLTNGVSASVSVSTSATWRTNTFSVAPTISGSTSYGVMLISDGAAVRIYYSATTGGSQRGDTSNSYASPLSPTDWINTNTTLYRLYANTSTTLNYRLDAEEQFTNVDNSTAYTEKYMAISTGTWTTTENLTLQIRNTVTNQWDFVVNLTKNSWNNVTIDSYWNTTITIRFIDGLQTSDSVCDYWNIDAILVYPARTTVSLTIINPTNTTYETSSISVSLSGSGGTIDKITYNVKNGTTWIYASNQTYTTPTSMTGFINGTAYTFCGFVNNTDGLIDEDNIMFSVQIITQEDVYYTLTILTPLHGSTEPTTGDHIYLSGTNVSLVAAADAGYSFAAWQIEDANQTTTASTWFIVMDSDYSAKAYFAANTYILSINNVGSGSVQRNASEPYSYGQVVNLTAVPSQYWFFNAWSDGISGSTNPYSLTISTNISITATFSQNTYTIGVTINSPTNTTYTTTGITVNLSTSGNATVTSLTWNCKNGSTWIYGSNQTYTIEIVKSGFVNGTSYKFYGWATSEEGVTAETTVMFSETIPPTIYTISITITNPQATIYTSPYIPIQLSTSGNDTNPVITWNAKFSNGTWLFESNQTYTINTSMTIGENATDVLFCVLAYGDNQAYDYKTITFTELNYTYPITITIISPTATIYQNGVNNIPVQVSVATAGSNTVTTWNIQFSNSTWLYVSNQTYTGTTTATINEYANKTAKFCIHSINDELYQDYKEVSFSIQYLTSYTLSITMVTPTNTTYPTASVPIYLSLSGNGTGTTVSWNIKFTTGAWLYISNQTGLSATATINENQTNCLFAVYSINNEGNYDYKERYFTVSIVTIQDTYYISVTINSPTNTTYGISTISISLTLTGNGTSNAFSWNIKFHNGTWLYQTNQTSTSTFITIATNETNCLFTVLATNAQGNYYYSEVYFSTSISPSLGSPWFAITLVLVVVGAGGSAYWYYRKATKTKTKEAGE